MRKISTAIVALATLALAAPASAGEILLTGSNYTTSSETFTGSDGVEVRVSAWSIDSSLTVRNATLGVWDYGLGVIDYWNENHTTDNSGWKDFLVFQFDQSVELDNALFVSGWHGLYDTDATIGYGTSSIEYDSPLSVADLAPLAPNLYSSNSDSEVIFDWGNFNYRNINPDDHAGNFWLVGASFDSQRYYDGFKLKYLTYSAPPPPAVPEPATWLMMILGFGLVGGVMRREKGKGAPALA